MTSIALLFMLASQQYHLPSGLLSALCYVESGHHVNAIHRDDGTSSSLGLCQVKLSTARQLGYKGSEKTLLNDPRVNVNYSAAYLSHQLHRYNGDLIGAISAYNMGSFRVNHTGKPLNASYVRKVLNAWKDGK